MILAGTDLLSSEGHRDAPPESCGLLHWEKRMHKVCPTNKGRNVKGRPVSTHTLREADTGAGP